MPKMPPKTNKKGRVFNPHSLSVVIPRARVYPEHIEGRNLLKEASRSDLNHNNQ
jgi:hypothetical protein